MNTSSEPSQPDENSSSTGFRDNLIQVIAELKDRLQARYERHFPGKKALIEQVLEEAESVAWCTPFPHLFLPDLAEVRIAQFSRTDNLCVR